MSKKEIELECAGKVHAGDTMVLVKRETLFRLQDDRDTLRKALVGVCTTDDVELLTAMVKKYETTHKRHKFANHVIAAMKALLEVRP